MYERGKKYVKEAELTAILGQVGPEREIINAFYDACLPMIRKMAARYSNLDPSVGFDDLEQQGYFGAVNTFHHFRKGPEAMKITTYFHLHLKKSFAELCEAKNRLVILSFPDGKKEIISYQKFQKIKKKLPQEVTWTVISRFISYEMLEGNESDD